MYWFDLLAVQGTLKGLLQHHSSKIISFSALSFLYGLTLTSIHAAAAKSLQSCLTLCDPIDGSSPGSPVPAILQARTLEWVVISFSNVWKWKVKVKSLSRVRLVATPWTAAYQASPSMGFSRQEYWSGEPLPSLIALTGWTFVGKVMSLLFNILSRLVMAFLPRSKHHLISLHHLQWFGTQENEVSHCFYCFPIYFYEVMGWMPWSSFSECWALSQLFHSPLSLSSRGSLVLHFCQKCGVICISEVINISPSNLDSSLFFIQSSVSHDVLWIEVK